MKKNVAAAVMSVSSTEAFPMVGLALQLEVPTVAASICGPKVGEECRNSDLYDWLEAVAASIHLKALAANYMQVEAPVDYREILKRNPQALAPFCRGWRRREQEEDAAGGDGRSEPWIRSRAGDINQQRAAGSSSSTPLLHSAHMTNPTKHRGD
jgi:hypothetical protein